MCTRYLLLRSAEKLAAATGVAGFPSIPPRYNAAPGQPLPIVRRRNGRREAACLRFGLVPARTGPPGATPLINARAETAADKPVFREAFRSRRCLVPADGFYEWQRGPHGPRPWLFEPVDGSLLYFAGLWESFPVPGSNPLETFAILTTVPGPVVAPIHDRRPVLLPPDSCDEWLDESTPLPRLRPLMDAGAAVILRARPVNPRLNNVAHDDPACLAPPPAPPAQQLDLGF